MTMPDEYTAQHHDVEEAEQAEDALHGRPFELSAARSKGLLADLVRDKLGLVSVVFLVGLVGAAIVVPIFRDVDPNAGNLSNSLAFAGVARRNVEPPSRYRLAGLRRLRPVALGRANVAHHRCARSALRRDVRRARRSAVGLQGWSHRPLAHGLGRRASVVPRPAAGDAADRSVGGSITTITLILAVNGWMVYARMTRGVVLSVRERPFVEAAEIIGCKPKRVVFTHILPNLVTPLATLSVLEFARIILAEAASASSASASSTRGSLGASTSAAPATTSCSAING